MEKALAVALAGVIAEIFVHWAIRVGAGLILRTEKTIGVALAGVIAQIFVHWAIEVDATRQTLRPNGQKYRFDPLNRRSIPRRIKLAPKNSKKVIKR